jgi:hypothetical protein
VPAFSFCGARCAAGAWNHAPRPSERFQGVPGHRGHILVAFLTSSSLLREVSAA